MGVEVLGVLGLLAVVAWKLAQLVEVAKDVRAELVSARWDENARLKRLESQVQVGLDRKIEGEH